MSLHQNLVMLMYSQCGMFELPNISNVSRGKARISEAPKGQLVGLSTDWRRADCHGKIGIYLVIVSLKYFTLVDIAEWCVMIEVRC